MLYTFFTARPSWFTLAKADKSRAIAEYLAKIDDFKNRLTIRAYSTIGLRRDTDFLLWLTSRELPPIQVLTEGLRTTAMAPHLDNTYTRSEEHTSELQSRLHLVCRLLLEKKKTQRRTHDSAAIYT